jgi:hypothetical protein
MMGVLLVNILILRYGIRDFDLFWTVVILFIKPPLALLNNMLLNEVLILIKNKFEIKYNNTL